MPVNGSWLVTGVAGFIGSHLLEHLLKIGAKVIGVDDFSTGTEFNLLKVAEAVGPEAFKRFVLVKKDIRYLNSADIEDYRPNYLAHLAAAGSVEESVEDPLNTNSINVDGFLNVLKVCRDLGIKSGVYASSWEVYGDNFVLPLSETHALSPLSPFAASKVADENYACAFNRCYGMDMKGLRFFNVFGPRQNSEGEHAAVIPRWIKNGLQNEPCILYGDGLVSRDFVYVVDLVKIIAMMRRHKANFDVINICSGRPLKVKELFDIVRKINCDRDESSILSLKFEAGRVGEIRESWGCSEALYRLFPEFDWTDFKVAMQETMNWYETQWQKRESGEYQAMEAWKSQGVVSDRY